MAMTLEEDALLRLMMRENAVIDLESPGDIFPAFQGGDRRKRPVFWIEKFMLDRLVTLGGIMRDEGKARISARMKARFCAGSAGAHRDMEERDVYTPDGVSRRARVNHRTSALRSLARKCDTYGEPILSAAQVEAGEQFAKDYALGGLGFTGTQNFENPGVDGAFRADAQENAIISRMDRRKRVSEAISCLGAGLDRAVIAVCCDGTSMGELERTEKWAKNSGRTILTFGLDRLVAFYGTMPGVRAEVNLQSGVFKL